MLSKKGVSFFIGCLITIDLFFIILYGSYHFELHNVFSYDYSIEKDGGYAEIYQYLKIFLIIILCGILAYKKRANIFLSWLIVFSYILIDDVLMLHEKMGRVFLLWFSFDVPFGLRMNDAGEAFVYVVFGGTLFILTWLVYLRSNKMLQKISKNIFYYILAFAFCAGVIDMVHVRYNYWPWVTPLAILEDGGEMIVMSCLVGYLLNLINPQV